MAELAFAVLDAAATIDAATPIVTLRLRITSAAPVQAAALRCQVRIDPARRPYDREETAKLGRVLGPADHPAAARPLLWTHVALNVPSFVEATTIDLLLPCPLDLRTGPATYLGALAGGAVPITLFFSGTVFHGAAGGALRVALLGSTAEARFDLPVAVCREAASRHHGEAALVALRSEVIARLEAFRSRHALAEIDDAIDALLDRAEAS